MDRAPAVGMKGFTNPGSKGSVPTSLVCDVPRGVWLLEKSCRLHHGTEVFGQALEVQHPPDQITLLSHPHEPSPAKAPQPMPILASPNSSSMSLRQRWDRRSASLCCRMRTHA